MGIGSGTLTSIKHKVNWKTSQGFQPHVEFVATEEQEEYRITNGYFSLRQGHSRIQYFLAKLLSLYNIPLESANGHPIRIWAEKDVPDPARAGYLKIERHDLINPGVEELEDYINDSRWSFYFEILRKEDSNSSSVRYPVFLEPKPLGY
jgi:hypothetical protein